MANIEIDGKIYEDIADDTQQALRAVNIYTFKYFPKDRLWLASEMCAGHFGIERWYKINPSMDNGPKIVYKGDRIKDLLMYKKVSSGKEESVSERLRTRDGQHYINVSLSVTSWDESGKPTEVSGVVQELDDHLRQMEFLKFLSDDYSFVYFVDFVNDQATMYRYDENITGPLNLEKLAGQPLPYRSLIEEYALKYALPDEFNELCMVTSQSNLQEQFRENKTFMHEYKILVDGRPSFIRFKAVDLSEGEELTQAVVGFSNVDREKKHEWETLAYIDPITAGYNYTYYSEKLKEADEKGYIVSMDIRFFKIINSACGMQMGDRVLQEVSRIVASAVGNNGFYGHVNADHFVFYLNMDTEDEVIEVMKDISGQMDDLVAREKLPKITAYFGVTNWIPGDRNQVKFSEANTAKHRIKANKDINYGFYLKEDIEAAIEERRVEDAFDSALSENQFEVWYQPKYSPVTNELTGAEALVRWRMPNGELLPPGRFIPIYEKTGLIRQLDRYMFTAVCMQQKEWIDKIGRTIPVSVNLSRASLYYENIVEEYREIVDSIGIVPELVPIEITESAAVDNKEIKKLADRFFNAGFSLHIDDFGTGYSSLSTLNMMRFDTLKLDKSLIDYIGEFGGNRLIRHTVALAKDLGLHVTAEGVETDEQVQFLKAVDCDNIQGFFYSRPMPAAFFAEKLANEKTLERYTYHKGQTYTFPAMVDMVRRHCSKEAARHIEGHSAIQINLTGEGEGSFYVEFDRGLVNVQPYEYYDRSAMITLSSDTLANILKNGLSIAEAYRSGQLRVEGDWGVIMLLEQVTRDGSNA